MNFTSKEGQLKQHEIRYDVPFEVYLGSKKYHCRYLKEWVSGQISYLIAKCDPTQSAEVKDVINLMVNRNTLSAKCISMLILGSYWKIKLFHWYFWRYIYRNYSSRELTNALTQVYEALDLSFFFQNSILLDQMNTLRRRMTKTELKQLSQELQSGKNPLL
jgi:hypothetical protein